MPENRPAVVVGHLRRAAFLVTGRDAGTYLHSQMSNDIAALESGGSCQSFVLEPTGKIDALIRVTNIGGDPASYLVDLDDDDPARLAARLARFKIRVAADIAPQAVEVVAVRAADRSADATPQSLEEVADVARRVAAWAADAGVRALIVPAWWGDGRAVDVIMMGTESPRLAAADALFSGDPTGPSLVLDETLEALRVRCGWPSMGAEIRPGETIPAATGVVARAVSFTKGCYPGQELVERMDSRGSSAPQSLRIVPLAVLGEVERGSTVVVDGIDVGTVTSVADDLALAYVSRSVSLGAVVGDC